MFVTFNFKNFFSSHKSNYGYPRCSCLYLRSCIHEFCSITILNSLWYRPEHYNFSRFATSSVPMLLSVAVRHINDEKTSSLLFSWKLQRYIKKSFCEWTQFHLLAFHQIFHAEKVNTTSPEYIWIFFYRDEVYFDGVSLHHHDMLSSTQNHGGQIILHFWWNIMNVKSRKEGNDYQGKLLLGCKMNFRRIRPICIFMLCNSVSFTSKQKLVFQLPTKSYFHIHISTFNWVSAFFIFKFSYNSSLLMQP